ncbi:MAG: Rieske 2Fe-2S domain-containing protein [Burkholderiaceae bacterium]
MLSAADNAIFTQTGPDTPMGDVFRRFWLPVCLGQEIRDADVAPRRVTLLGESLLLFRQTDGQIGLVEPRCPHRGADLYWGRNEECGLRCVYHGWKFTADGSCVDIPNMVPGRQRDAMMASVKVRSYPVREAGDIVWAYLGPGDPPTMHGFEFCAACGCAPCPRSCRSATSGAGGRRRHRYRALFLRASQPARFSIREVYEDDRAR